jgi:endo-1,4-beta-xylanase
LTRRATLAGGAITLAGAALPRFARAGIGEEKDSLGALAAAKGLRFGASFAVHELEEPYGPAYAEIYRRETKVIASEVELKLQTLRPTANTLEFGPADRLFAFAAENALAVRGHTLIWHDALPDWIERLGHGEAEQLLETHIEAVLERYRGRVLSWDVVNEPIAPWDRLPGNLRGGPFYAALGEGYIARSFRLARQIDPTARLVLNEAQTESEDEMGLVFRDSLSALLRRLRDIGVAIDVIGLQAHLDSRRPYDFPRFAAFVEELANEGYEIAISELDVNDQAFPADPRQRDQHVADLYTRFLGAVLQVKAVKTLVLWQLADSTSWLYRFDVEKYPRAQRRPRPLLYDQNFMKKRAWLAVAAALEAMPPR